MKMKKLYFQLRGQCLSTSISAIYKKQNMHVPNACSASTNQSGVFCSGWYRPVQSQNKLFRCAVLGRLELTSE